MNFTNKETKVSDWINNVTKAFNLSLNMDGNNVDIDSEQVELASEQIKYKTLAASISSEFSRMKTAMGR